MRVLSIVGIIMSVIGLITSIYIMTEAKCPDCYGEDGYYSTSGGVPGDAIGGSMVTMLVFVFFLVMSIIGVTSGSANKPHLAQTIPPFQANPYPNYQQAYQQNPYTQNQYPQNPYTQTPYQNPVAPNPYQNPNTQNPYQNPNTPNPYQKPEPPKDTPPATPPPTNPWEPK